MSAIEEIIQALEEINEKIEGAVTGVAGAESRTDGALDQAVALGATATAEGLAQVKDEIHQLLAQLMAAGEGAKQVTVTARAVATFT
jgi:uncharacterized protein YukE